MLVLLIWTSGLSDEKIEENPSRYTLPLPRVSSTAPTPIANTVIEMANTNGIFTITDQAFPAEVAAQLFNVDRHGGHRQ